MNLTQIAEQYIAHNAAGTTPTLSRGFTPGEWENIKKSGAKQESKLCTIPALRFSLVPGNQIRSSISGVYFIQSGDCGAVKIGTAECIRSRRGILQSGNPERLHIRAYIPLKYRRKDAEELLHMYFARHRVRGEWFDCQSVLSFLGKEEDTMLHTITSVVPSGAFGCS